MFFCSKDALVAFVLLAKGIAARDFPRQLSYVNATVAVPGTSTSFSQTISNAPASPSASLVVNGTISIAPELTLTTTVTAVISPTVNGICLRWTQ